MLRSKRSGAAMLLKFLNPLKVLGRLPSWWIIARSRIFDANWYRAAHPEVDGEGWSPLVHYVFKGAQEGNRPHLLFDPAWYETARGSWQRASNPLIDYIKFGAAAGVEPSPYFSSPFYRDRAGDLGGLTPLGHFVAFGSARGLAPTPLFDRAWYLDNNPDVRRAGFNPFLHFVASGARDGRSPGPLFDAAWYRMKNVDARDAGFEPLHHYLAVGAGEGRNPSAFFDTKFYIANFPEPSITAESALLSYAESGRDAWRSTHAILPAPNSPVAYFEDFPWRGPASAPGALESPFRILIVDMSQAGATGPAANAPLLARLAALPGLDVHLVTNAALEASCDAIASLDLSRPDLALLDQRIVVDRLLRALKFRDPNATVIEAACAMFPLQGKCAEIGLRHYDLASMPQRFDADWAEWLANCSGYRPPHRPTISVIVPNYNHARYLDQRLGSIFAQRLKPDEIIFLDDGSCDESLTVAKAWQAKSAVPFTIAANETNSGSPFKQWAKGIERATGDLVWIAESDDSSCPRFLERMTSSFADPEVTLAYCDSQVIGTDGEILSQSYRFYTDTLDATKWLSGYVEDGAREIMQALAIKNTIPNVSAVLFKRAALRATIESIQSFRFCGDWWAYVACLRQGKIAFCPQALNQHRQEPAGVTRDGERATHAVREALTIKLSIFAQAGCDTRIVWLSLAQTIFEYALRSRSIAQGRPSFTRNEALADCLANVARILAAQGHGYPENISEITAYLRALAAESLMLSQGERQRFVAMIIEELQAIAVHPP